jgi:hypothetical protein
MASIKHEEVDTLLQEFGLDILKVPYYRPKLSLFLSEVENRLTKQLLKDPNEILEEQFLVKANNTSD